MTRSQGISSPPYGHNFHISRSEVTLVPSMYGWHRKLETHANCNSSSILNLDFFLQVAFLSVFQ